MKPITVTSPLLPNLDEFHEMLKQIWNSKWITNNGSFHKELERQLAEYLGVPYVSLFTNGTLPLITALQALRINGEVITTPYSFVATTHALWWNGIKPVFVDIDPSTGNIDPDKIEAAITPRTTAIMPVHVYGKPCDGERIDAIAKKYGLRVIYDAAHAFGVKVAPKPPKGGVLDSADPVLYERLKEFAQGNRNHPTQAEEVLWSILSRTREERASQLPLPTGGNNTPFRGLGGLVSILEWGDMSTLSFHATKVYNTIEGGALICHSKEMKQKIDDLKNFGFHDEVTVVAPGINSKMDEMRAAYGLLNLRQVDAAIEARHQVAIRYREALRNVEGISFFDDMPGVRHNYSYFPIFVDAKKYGMTRDELYEKMKAAGVYGRRYFYPLISEFSTYRGLESAHPNNLPNAHKMANSVICLPMHHGLSAEDIERIIHCILK